MQYTHVVVGIDMMDNAGMDLNGVYMGVPGHAQLFSSYDSARQFADGCSKRCDSAAVWVMCAGYEGTEVITIETKGLAALWHPYERHSHIINDEEVRAAISASLTVLSNGHW